MKQKTYRASATIRIDCEMDISADSEDEAMDRAENINVDEWMSHNILSEFVDDVEILGIKEERKRCKPRRA